MPFTPARIKYLLTEKTGKSLTALADEWKVRIEELSMCIRQVPGRVYPELRIKVCEAIGYSVEEVFGVHPLTTALLSNETEQRSAA
jgi:hypothetical protein